MPFSRCMALCLLVVGSAAGALELEPPREPAAAEVVLPNQLGGSDSIAAHRGNVTVAMVVTAARLRNLKAWQRDLQQRFEALDFVLIADVPGDPPASFERVVERLAKKVPEEVPVLIDLERIWARELQLDTMRPNILLFGRDGTLVDRFRGLATSELVDEVAQHLQILVGP